MQFQQRYKPFTEPLEVDPDYILYTDMDGQLWTVPLNVGNWMDTDLYQPWLAAGNKPLPPA